MNVPSIITRSARIAGLAVIGAGLVAGTAAPALGSDTAARGYGWLRLAHLSPNTPPVDVYLYSFGKPRAMIVLHHVAYGTVSGYEKVHAGEYTVAMRGVGASPSSPPVLSASVNVRPGHAYTVAGLGPANGLRLQVLSDRLTTPPGKALVRVIQASLAQHRVTVKAGGTVVASRLAFGSVTSYQVVKAGTWEVSATGPTQHTRSAVTLAAGSIHTIVVLDDPGHLALDDLTDAAGSHVAPAGAPATGFGGTAPRPGRSAVAWIALAGAGLLLAGSGTALAWQHGKRRPAGRRRRHVAT